MAGGPVHSIPNGYEGVAGEWALDASEVGAHTIHGIHSASAVWRWLRREALLILLYLGCCVRGRERGTVGAFVVPGGPRGGRRRWSGSIPQMSLSRY